DQRCCFFQAEDGIRDWSVTGVQTCALPILTRRSNARQKVGFLCLADRHGIRDSRRIACPVANGFLNGNSLGTGDGSNERRRGGRSEERRVGKEGGHRGVRVEVTKKKQGGEE